MDIRAVSSRPDYGEIIDLIKAEWPPEFGIPDDAQIIGEMEKSHNEKTDRVKYLWDEGRVIGFYRYSLWPRDDLSGKTAHTMDIAVRPGYQKMGLGTLLMKDLIEDCRTRGFERLLSRSFKSNPASIGLHRSLGFVLHLETEDSFVWELEL